MVQGKGCAGVLAYNETEWIEYLKPQGNDNPRLMPTKTVNATSQQKINGTRADPSKPVR